MKHSRTNKFFKLGNNIMIYGSFLLPIAFYITNAYNLGFKIEFGDFGGIAWFFLIIIMIVRPLVDLFPSFLLFTKLLSVRRGMGIMMGMAGLTHGLGYFYAHPSAIKKLAIGTSNLWAWNGMFVYGIIAMVFATLLLITSNNFSVRFLGMKWKWLHKTVLIVFYMTCIHVALVDFGKIDPIPLILGVGVFILRFFVWKKTHPSSSVKSSSVTSESMTSSGGDQYVCGICQWVYDESKGDPDGGIAPGTRWEDIPASWKCPVCGVGKNDFTHIIRKVGSVTQEGISYLGKYERTSDELEGDFRTIFEKAVNGKEEISAMGTKKNWRNLFEDIVFLPAQLARRVYDEHELSPDLSIVIGPNAKSPITLKVPFYVSHMSFGSMSREAKIALAKGSKSAGTMICGGEGGLLQDEFDNASTYVFEYSTGRFGATEANMKKAHAIEIKIGQAAKAGLGGHLLGAKVTEEIAAVRGVPVGQDIISPANHTDIKTKEDLKERVAYLRELSEGKPIGIKIVASHIEDDLEVALFCKPDFITIDCRGGATGAAPNHVKDNVCIPAPYAIYRARKFLDEKGIGRNITLLVTGGFRTSADITKAIALGADGVGVSTLAMIGIGCQQYRVCHKGTCPVGIATQNPDLRARFDMYKSAEMLARLFHVYKREMEDFVRILGKKDIKELDSTDLVALSSEISEHTDVKHA